MASVTLGLEQEAAREDEVLENLKKDLKASVRDVYRAKANMEKQLLGEQNIRFMRLMEKAWLTNVIIKERYMRSYVKAIIADRTRADTPDPEGCRLVHKTLDYNKKIRGAMSVGLEGILLGPPSNSNKRKRYEEEDKEEELEELKDLKKNNEEVLVKMAAEHKGKVAKNLKYYYRRAGRFAKVESREEHLASIVNSLLDRERERETEKERRESTENEILGYILLEETAASSLQFPHVLTSPGRAITPPNSVTPTSIESGPEKIVVEFPKGIFIHDANDESKFHTKSASKIDSYQIKDMDQMRRDLVNARAAIEKSKACIEMCDKLVTSLAAERQFETKLLAHYEDLSDIWLARCFNALSQTETKYLHEIIRLARKAIQASKKTLPTITLPIFPTFRSSYC